MASPIHPLATRLVAHTRVQGFNLVGFVPQAEFDACQPSGHRAVDAFPGCGSILLLGSGGRSFWESMHSAGMAAGTPRPDRHPIDTHTGDLVASSADWLAQHGIASRVVRPDDRPLINFMQLAEMAGWGTISPVIGILLHPEFGPWVSLRAALLIEGEPFGAVPAERHQPFQPCLDCHMPCVDACPVRVYDIHGVVDIERCARHRHAGHCADGCEVRRACPVGAAHRYGPDEERFRHAYSLFALRRHFGLGPWKFVPRSLR